MIKASDIVPLRTASSDYVETEELKKCFRQLRAQRHPFYLEASELEQVFHWKLGNQYGRGKTLRDSNPPDVYPIVTQAAFSIYSQKIDYELEVRLGLLTALPGVGVPVASAILALIDPDHYCVIDFRGWRTIFGEDKRIFSISDYKKYRDQIEGLSQELGWSVQEVDLAVWEYDRTHANA